VRIRFLFLLGIVLLTATTAANKYVGKFYPDGFCFVMAEMSEGAKKSANGLKMDDTFLIKSVTPDCPHKMVAFTISADIEATKFEDKLLNALLCAEGGEKPNPYSQAVQNGWDLDVRLTFPDGTEKNVKLCH
jgi:hypothetical protein